MRMIEKVLLFYLFQVLSIVVAGTVIGIKNRE